MPRSPRNTSTRRAQQPIRPAFSLLWRIGSAPSRCAEPRPMMPFLWPGVDGMNTAHNAGDTVHAVHSRDQHCGADRYPANWRNSVRNAGNMKAIGTKHRHQHQRDRDDRRVICVWLSWWLGRRKFGSASHHSLDVLDHHDCVVDTMPIGDARIATRHRVGGIAEHTAPSNAPIRLLVTAPAVITVARRLPMNRNNHDRHEDEGFAERLQHLGDGVVTSGGIVSAPYRSGPPKTSPTGLCSVACTALRSYCIGAGADMPIGTLSGRPISRFAVEIFAPDLDRDRRP